MSTPLIAILVPVVVAAIAAISAIVTVRVQSGATVKTATFTVEMENLNKRAEKIERERDALDERRKEENIRLADRLSDTQKKLDELTREFNKLRDAHEGVLETVERQSILLEQQNGHIAAKDAEIVRLTQRVRDLEAALADAQIEISALKGGKP